MVNTKAIAIVGVGGQGTVLASDILTEGLVNIGYDVKKTEQHGLSQRGGSVNCFIKYGEKVYSPLIGMGEADLLLAFEKIEAMRWLPRLKKSGSIIVNNHEIYPSTVKMGKAVYPADAIIQLQNTIEKSFVIDATEEAQKIGTTRVASIVLLGAAVKLLGLESYDWISIIKKKVPEKFVEMNVQAYEVGLNSIK